MSDRTADPSGSPQRGSLEVTKYAGGPFQQNGYLVRCTRTDRVAVIDPGAVAPTMVQALRDGGWTVEGIYLTHGHLDHVEGLEAIREFTDAPIHLHPADLPLLDRAVDQAAAFGMKFSASLPPPDKEIVPGEALPVGDGELQVRFAPGHSPGHVVLYAPADGFALVGDVIFQGSIGRTDLPGGSLQRLMDSIKSQILTLPDETRLLTGHGPETTVGQERRGNPFLISQFRGEFA